MRKRALPVILAAGAVAIAALFYSCPKPASRHALLFRGNTFYLCCNMYYPAPKFNDANYQSAGKFIPLGTPVQVLRMTDVDVTFIDTNTNRSFTWVKRYARVPLASLLKVWLMEEDPHKVVNGFSENIRSLIYKGKIEVGMTKQQVIFALGFPPQHRTPSTSLDIWTYWEKGPYTVHFNEGVVASIAK